MRATAILGLVQRLLAHESNEGQVQASHRLEPHRLEPRSPNQATILDQSEMVEAAERVLDKLQVRLSKVIGQEGFRTLMARALTLTTSQFPHLGSVRVGANGSLAGLQEAAGTELQETGNSVAQQDANAGAAALVAQLLGLLVTFIGEDLMLRILSKAWPEFALPELELPEIELPEIAPSITIGKENEILGRSETR